MMIDGLDQPESPPIRFKCCYVLDRTLHFAMKTTRSMLMLCGAVTALLTFGPFASAQAEATDEALVEKPLAQISDNAIGALGQKALGIRSNDWKHSESPHFVYHYFTPFIAQAVANEAEFYYRVIAKELDKDTTQWERKSHIFIFEQPADWQQFRQVGGLEPWTGGIHSQGQLFIMRNPQVKWKGNSLAHEVTHLVTHRFYGEGIPLWLDEGMAEYCASRWYASYWRLRGYNSRPRSVSVSEESYIPLATLSTLLTYPAQDDQVAAFYAESERLVRFLSAADKKGFLDFFEAMSKGNRFDTALEKALGSKFFNVDALERDFKPYAMKDSAESPN
jgi:hypothetical protein